MDAVYSFPGLILAIAVAAVLGPGMMNIAVSIAVVYAPTYFRVVRNQVASVKTSFTWKRQEHSVRKIGKFWLNTCFPTFFHRLWWFSP